MLTAFCVQHDANHGSYFKQRRWNHLVGWSTDSLLGFSSYAWRVKHNVAHHTYTNVDGYDDDATQVPLAPLHAVPARPALVPLPAVLHLADVHADGAALADRRRSRSLPPGRGRRERAAARRAAGTSSASSPGRRSSSRWAIVIPLLVYPWWAVLGAYVGFAMITSLIMATTFQLAHCVEEASFASADELRAERRIWAVHEVETTVDFCPRNPVLTWMLGGLNFQIEHHLFPKVPHTHYPKIAEIVRRNCAKHGVRYSFHPSLGRALRSHFLHLRDDGAARAAARDRDGVAASVPARLWLMGAATVEEIAYTPVKGLALAFHDEVELELAGVRDNRRFHLVGDDGRLANGKLAGKLVQVAATCDLDGTSLALRFPDGRWSKARLLSELRSRRTSSVGLPLGRTRGRAFRGGDLELRRPRAPARPVETSRVRAPIAATRAASRSSRRARSTGLRGRRSGKRSTAAGSGCSSAIDGCRRARGGRLARSPRRDRGCGRARRGGRREVRR